MSNRNPAVAKTFTAEEIQNWLTARLAKEVRLKPADIDGNRPFAQYGVDSVQAARMSGDLEDWAGRELSPSLLYDYPTVTALTQYLTAELCPQLPAVAVASPA
jgi:acyl carrier protein